MRILAQNMLAAVIVGSVLAIYLIGMVRADESSSGSWFGSLSGGSRLQIQTDLIVTGFYGDSVDAKFGPSTYAALTKYQTSVGQTADGTLTYSQRKQLRGQAADVLRSWGMQRLADDEVGATYVVPKKLMPLETKDGPVARYADATGTISLKVSRVPQPETFEGLYIKEIGRVDGDLPNYLRFRTDSWVVSGHSDGMLFYTMMKKAADGSSVGFTINASSDNSEEGGRLAVYEAARFKIADPAKVDMKTATAEPTAQSPSPTGVQPTPESESPMSTETAPPEPTEQPAPALPPSQLAGPVAPAGNGPTGHSGNRSASLSDESIGPFKLLADDATMIILDGEIDEGTPLEFVRAMRERPAATTIVLNSPGGWVDGGLLIASQVHDRGMTTYVPSGRGCYSACSFILLAGTKRQVDGELGVHQISMDHSGTGDLVSGQIKLSDILEALTDYGVDQRVVSLMLRTPPDTVHVFSAEELAAYGINN